MPDAPTQTAFAAHAQPLISAARMNGVSAIRALRNSIWLLPLVTIAAFSIVVSFLAVRDKHLTLEREYRMLELQAEMADARISASLETADNLMKRLVSAPAGQSWSMDHLSPLYLQQKLREQLPLFPELFSVFVADPTGQLIAARSQLGDGSLSIKLEGDFFKVHRDAPKEARQALHGQLFVLHPEAGIQGTTSIVLSRAIVDAKGQFKGIIGTTLELRHVRTILDASRPDNQGLAMLISRGAIFSPYPLPEDFDAAFKQKLDAAALITQHIDNSESTQPAYVSVIRRAEYPDLRIVVSHDQESVFAQWHLNNKNRFWLVASGGLLMLFLTWLVISERIKAEKTLRTSETTLKKAQAVARMGSWTIDPVTTGFVWSEETYRLFGVPINTLITLERLTDCIHPDDRKQFMDEFKAALSGEAFDVGHRIVVNGETLWVRQKADLIFDSNGVLQSGTGIVQDVTTQILAAEQLGELLDFTEKIIAESPVGIAVFHTDGHCVLVNDSMAKIFGENMDEMRKGNFRNHLEWQRLELLDAAEAALQSGKMVRKTASGLKRAGVEISIDCEFAPITRQGTPHLMVLIRDVSEYRAAEHALKKATQMAEEANRAKSEFLANMSHEIRTPMNAVIGLAQLALDQTTDPTLGDYLRQMYSSATALLRIINDILDYSKIEAGRLGIEKKEFSTVELTRNLIGMFRSQAHVKGIELKAKIESDVPPQLMGDSLRLDQVLINLVSNALKFTEHGHIVIGISRVAPSPSQPAATGAAASPSKVRLRFAVADTGLGMNSETQAQLFKPFIQADGSITRRFGGTGLGLTISRRLVMMMGGDIHVSSSAGGGSCFSFDLEMDLPATTINPSRRAIDAKLTVARTLDLAATGLPIAGTRVLLVEDDQVNQRVVSEVLRRAGLEVVIANHGVEAMNCMATQVFDAILMDLEMPEMDGFETTRQIRANAQWASVPVIAFTAAVLLHDREKCLEAGMTDFVSKPTQPKVLLNTLLQHIPARHRFADFSTGDSSVNDVEATLDIHSALTALAALRIQLEQNDFIAATDLRSLKSQLEGITIPEVNHLFDAISRYDYASAKSALADLLHELGSLGEPPV